jgi:REP element-mobilizing transposase RayT
MNYFITFRCYGTWLHGDARGSVDYLHNQFNEPFIEADARLESRRRLALKSRQVILSAAQRQCAENAIRDVARHRDWTILALSVLSNHVHVVVATGENTKPEKVLIDFKAWSTRRLREQQLVPPDTQLWAEHGSTRYLWDEKSLMAACHYVEEQAETEHDA